MHPYRSILTPMLDAGRFTFSTDGVWALDPAGAAIFLFPNPVTGTPLRRIAGPGTTLRSPVGIAVWQERVYVSDGGDSSIKIFDRSSNGDAAPIATIAGDRTRITSPGGIAVDPGSGVILVVNGPRLLCFEPAKFGNIPPYEDVGFGTWLTDVAVHADGDILAVCSHVANVVAVYGRRPGSDPNKPIWDLTSWQIKGPDSKLSKPMALTFG
jgi:DNA-binding beta-propeller fold protein YncE